MTDSVVDLREISDSFVVHYGGQLRQVNAFTFANSLLALAESIRIANAIINPGQDIEIALEALGEGSFRAKIRTTKKSLKNLFSLQGGGTGLVLGLIGNYIWQAANPILPPQIVVNDDSVVFQYGNSQVILPREAYPAYEQTKNSKALKEGIAKTFDELDKDSSITEFGLTRQMEDKELMLHVSHDRFPIISGSLREDPESKEEVKRVKVQIVRAILEKSRRLWEFVWVGTRISAPVTDADFYNDLYCRKVSLATGDLMEVDLVIKQRPIGETGIYENSAYEVKKVHSHTPRPMQSDLEDDDTY